MCAFEIESACACLCFCFTMVECVCVCRIGSAQSVIWVCVMEVRFTAKLNSQLGLVQEQRATVLSFLFQDADQSRYQECAPGTLFKPTYCLAGIWLEVHDFKESPLWQDALPYVGHSEQRARSLLLYRPVQQEFVWRSSISK